MGENIWGRPKKPGKPARIRPRPARPAPQKQSFPTTAFSSRPSKKLRGYYGNISERQFRGIYQEARRLKGDSGAHMIGFLLERRLDALIFRAKFVPTVFGRHVSSSTTATSW